MTSGALSRQVHFSPLRYPGGKGKLASFVKKIMKANHLLDGEYIEPYAGGAAIAMELLLHEYVSRVHINDISGPVHAFWWSCFHQPDELCRRIINTPCSLDVWDRQKFLLTRNDNSDLLSLGFAAFFLNRTNRSGIFNGGPIGGRDQSGTWKMDARYNARELARRIQSLARLRDRVEVTQLDAVEFLRIGTKTWPDKALIYLDPPYYVKGRELYYNFYKHSDHAMVSECVQGGLRQRWIVSYDAAPQIEDLYSECAMIRYSIGYTARNARKGTEVMFFSPGLQVPTLEGPVTLLPSGRGTRAPATESGTSTAFQMPLLP